MNGSNIVLEDSKYEFLYDYLQTTDYYRCGFKSNRTITVSNSSHITLSTLDVPVSSSAKYDECAIAARVSSLSGSLQTITDTEGFIVNKVEILNTDGSPYTVNGNVVYGLLQMAALKSDKSQVNNDVQISFVYGITPTLVPVTGTFLFNYNKCNRLTRRNQTRAIETSQQYTVDGVQQYTSVASFPSIGRVGNLYVDTTNKESYYWNPIRLQYELCGMDFSVINVINGGNSTGIN